MKEKHSGRRKRLAPWAVSVLGFALLFVLIAGVFQATIGWGVAALQTALNSPTPTPTAVPENRPSDELDAYRRYADDLLPLGEALWQHPEAFPAREAAPYGVTCTPEEAFGAGFREHLPFDVYDDLCTFVTARPVIYFGYEPALSDKAAAVWFMISCEDGYTRLYYIRAEDGLDEATQAAQVAATIERETGLSGYLLPMDAMYWYAQVFPNG